MPAKGAMKIALSEKNSTLELSAFIYKDLASSSRAVGAPVMKPQRPGSTLPGLGG
jgi:hypothetical protein